MAGSELDDTRMAFVVAITGGIASGKSTLSKLIADKLRTEPSNEVILVDADKLGHLAYIPGTPAYRALVERFGAGQILAEGVSEGGSDPEIDRRKLGGIVFSDKSQMDALCSIVWPVIRSSIEKTIAETTDTANSDNNSKKYYIVLEAAVMIEAKWVDLASGMVVVSFVDRDIAKSRLMERNSLTEADALKRIDAQMKNEERLVAVVPTGSSVDVTFEDNDLIFYEDKAPAATSATVIATVDNKGTEQALNETADMVVKKIQSSA